MENNIENIATNIREKFIPSRRIRIFNEKLKNFDISLHLGAKFYEDYSNCSYDEFYEAAFNKYFAKELELVRQAMRDDIETRFYNNKLDP